MTTELLENKIKDWMLKASVQYDKQMEGVVAQDKVWTSLPFQEMRKNFLNCFKNLGEEKASWLFYKNFNDIFLAEKNFIPCQIW